MIAWDGQLELDDNDWLDEEMEDSADCCLFCGDHYMACDCNEGARVQ